MNCTRLSWLTAVRLRSSAGPPRMQPRGARAASSRARRARKWGLWGAARSRAEPFQRGRSPGKPRGVGTKTTRDVGAAVVRAVRGDLGKVDVAPFDQRIGAFLAALSPALAQAGAPLT